MTQTGPLPAVELEAPGASDSAARMAALVMMGSPFSKGVWRSYGTADAVIDTDRGVLLIAVDQECDPADWAAVVDLIRIVGWDNGTRPNSDDPGEPSFDALAGVWTWRLEYVRLRYP